MPVAVACTCGGCGATTPLAAHLLYADAPALVLRCPGCTNVVLRYSSSRHGGTRQLRIDLTGARLVVLDLPEPD